jgi:hypothetical protein
LSLDLEFILSMGDKSSLSDLLAILMVENHSHGVFKIFEFLFVNYFDLIVIDLSLFHQREEDVGSQSLHLQIQLLGHLALL